MCDYFRDVWSELQTPDWMASTGLPLVVTLLGIAVAYLLFRRQLGNDERLRLASQHRAAAERLAFITTQAARQLKRTPADDEWWREVRWSEGVQVNDSLADAAGHLPRGAQASLERLVASIEGTWTACHVGAVGRNPDIMFHGQATMRLMEPLSTALLAAGERLQSWGGDAPDASSLVIDLPDGALPFDRDHGAEHQWLLSRRDDYRSRIDVMEGKSGGLSLVKPSGKTFRSPVVADEASRVVATNHRTFSTKRLLRRLSMLGRGDQSGA